MMSFFPAWKPIEIFQLSNITETKRSEIWLTENYKPIALLSALSNVFEIFLFKQIYEYLNSNNLLYQSKYGFRKDHSIELPSP